MRAIRLQRNVIRVRRLTPWTVCLVIASAMIPHGSAQEPRKTGADGSIQVSAFDVPFSSFGSKEAKAALIGISNVAKPPTEKGMAEVRKFFANSAEKGAARLRQQYPVEVENRVIAGIPVRIVKPLRNAANRDDARILICLHGGSFMWGEAIEAEVESIPIASVSGIQIVGVDYREAPEHRYPDAVNDALAVYTELLKTYDARQIGVFGGSAGAVLTGEMVAALLSRGMRVPGAIGLFNGGVSEMAGDSLYWANPLTGQAPLQKPAIEGLRDLPYFVGADMKSSLVLPGNSPETLKAFPPTLLLSGSRDFALSSVLYSERLLSGAQVETELHIWDGLSHASFGHGELPESQEMVRFTAAFFKSHLGTETKQIASSAQRSEESR